jgi:hypothetical protein
MKTASGIILTLCLLVFFTGSLFSQEVAKTSAAKPVTTSAIASQGKFIDNNKNGICDNHEAKGTCAHGKCFVDKNGDGKCDNCGSAGKCKEAGNCGGKGQCCGKGQPKGNCGEQGKHQGSCCSARGAASDPGQKK